MIVYLALYFLPDGRINNVISLYEYMHCVKSYIIKNSME